MLGKWLTGILLDGPFFSPTSLFSLSLTIGRSGRSESGREVRGQTRTICSHQTPQTVLRFCPTRGRTGTGPAAQEGRYKIFCPVGVPGGAVLIFLYCKSTSLLTTLTTAHQLVRSQAAEAFQGSSQLSHQRNALMCYFFLKRQSLIPFLGLARFNLGRKCKSVHSAALQACWLSKFCLGQCLSGILVISPG